MDLRIGLRDYCDNYNECGIERDTLLAELPSTGGETQLVQGVGRGTSSEPVVLAHNALFTKGASSVD